MGWLVGRLYIPKLGLKSVTESTHSYILGAYLPVVAWRIGCILERPLLDNIENLYFCFKQCVEYRHTWVSKGQIALACRRVLQP